MSHPESKFEHRRRTRKRKRMLRRLRRALLVVGLVGAAVVGLTIYQAFQAREALNEANRQLDALTGAVADGDTPAAQEALYAVQKATLSAQRNTGGPVWWLASKAPAVGDDVTALLTVADVADNVSQGVLPALIDASGTLSPIDLQPSNGRVELEPIEEVAPRLAAASAALEDNLSVMAGIDTGSLMSQIADPVAQLVDKLTEARSVSGDATRAAQLLPPMLGADGERTYLVMFQNNAEVRATGGIPGAVATITADHGKLTIQQQGDASSLGTYVKPVLPLTRDEVDLFGPNLGIFPGDVTFTPDYPRTAQLAQEMWRRSTGETVDGVISTDPVALSYLLAGTGPISVVDGTELSADNAVQLLLNQIYLDQPDPERQNVFFASAGQAVFEAVTSGQGDPRSVLDGVLRAADEHRTLIWSDHADEQSLLAPTKLSGALPTEASDEPDVGVYLNDGTGAKMDYYLDYDVGVDSVSCDGDGVQTLKVTVTMTSNAPADAASLPVSVRGPGYGARPGSIRTNVLVYAPFDGAIHKATIDGEGLISASLDHEGRSVALQTIDLAPGRAHTLSFSVFSGPGQSGKANLDVTPGFPGAVTADVGDSSCS